MLKIGKIGQFQRFFDKLIQKKSPDDAQEISPEIAKSVRSGSGYNYIGNVKVFDVDGKTLVLSDGSRWSPVGNLGLNQNHGSYWSRGDSVSLRWSGGNMFVLNNPEAEETSRWVFQGYVENWGKS